MTEKTRLEEDLELVQTRGRRWGVAIILLLVLLMGALAYSVSLNRNLLESERRIESLKLELDSLRIKMEALRIDAMKCTEGEKEAEGGESPPGSPPGEKKGQGAETVQDVPTAPSGEGLRP